MTKKARNRLLLEALPGIQRTARHLAYVSGSPRWDADELTQVGCLAVCEALRKGIKAKGDRVGYVVVIARRAMQRHCGYYASLIKTPRKWGNGFQPTIAILSLDMPLSTDSEQTLYDLLADGALEAAEEYAAAYDDYLDRLP